MRLKFWIRTSRQFSKEEIVDIPYTTDEEVIKDELEAWCERVFALWHTTDSRIRYGWENVYEVKGGVV